MANPWDKDPIAPAGFTPIGAGNPKLPGEVVLQRAEINRQGLITSKAGSDAAKAASDAVEAAARARIAGALAKAGLSKAQSDAVVAAQKADEARANDALATMAANSNVHGEQYLKQFVPPQMWNVVRAYARGDLGSRAGGLSSSMLPIIQHAMNYDPSASGTNFPARTKMQSDLASGDPKSAGGQLQAFERMLLHGSEVMDKASALGNTSSGFGAAPLNYLHSLGRSFEQDPRQNGFNEAVTNYAPEAQKAIAGALGGEHEREGRASHFSDSMAPDAVIGGLQSDAQQAMDAMGAVNDRYKRLMGRDIVDALSPAGKAAYDKIMAGGYDKAGKPLHPVAGYSPISTLGGSGGGTPDLGGGPAGGPTKTVRDQKTQALIDGMIHQGMSADQINAVIVPAGVSGPVDEKQVAAAQTFLKQHPDYRGGFSIAEREAPTSLLNRVAGSAPGAAVGAAVDAGLGGLSDEIAAVPGALASGRSYSDTLADYNARKQAAFAASPKAAFGGGLAGGIGGALMGGSLLRGGALAKFLGKAAPYVGGIAQGAVTGGGENNDNRLAGAAFGGIGGAAGYGAGALAAIPAGALLRTAAGQAAMRAAQRVPKIGGAFNGLTPAVAPRPSPADIAVNNAAAKAGPADIRTLLGEASQLGVPMSLADTAPQLTSLAGSAVRRSPNASQTAEASLFPRGRGQIDRLSGAVNRDLGPIANIPQLSADLTQQARTAAGPLYDKAYAAPGASSVQLDDLIKRPLSFQPGLKRAYNIAAEEGRDPTALGFGLDQEGNVTLNRVPSYQTLDYVKRGLDDTLEQHRDPITGKLQLNESTRAINNTKNTLLQRMDAVNPDYAAARQAYAGPVQARDALANGQDAFSMPPDEIRMMAGAQSPEHLAQMQLGFRSQLMNRANNVRDASNPFEATLGTPNARARVDALYPGNPGNANLFRTRDMEGQLARTTNDILGNSKTAQRQIADQAFEQNPLADLASAGLTMAAGGVPVGNIVKKGTLAAAKEAWQFGVGKKAVQKADDLAPLMFNTDPAAASASLDDLMRKVEEYKIYINNSRPTNGLGFFGRGVGNAAGSGY